MCVLVFADTAVSSFLPQQVELKVVGESVMGLVYSKELNLVLKDHSYILSYSCRSTIREYCVCRGFEGTISPTELEEFFTLIASLRDEGERAMCCDHPWTELRIVHPDGREKRIITAFEPIKVEQTLKIPCTSSPP